MKLVVASIFKFLFTFSFFRNRFFGIYVKIIKPLGILKNSNTITTTQNGVVFKLQLGDWISDNLFLLGQYENDELLFIQKHLNPHSIFIDIGANIGVYSLSVFKMLPKAVIIAFEPFTKNYQKLAHNIVLNNAITIKLEQLAITDKDTDIDIFYNSAEDNAGMASSYLQTHDLKETIKATSLDNYLSDKQCENIDFIKIDIEGNEYPALLGMRNTLLKHKPILLVEIEEQILVNTPYTSQNIMDYLYSLNYNPYKLNNLSLSSNLQVNSSTNFIFVHNESILITNKFNVFS